MATPTDPSGAAGRASTKSEPSLPRESDDRARYAVLTSTDDGWPVEHGVVAYDRAATLADLDAVGHPSADWLRGKLTTPWG